MTSLRGIGVRLLYVPASYDQKSRISVVVGSNSIIVGVQQPRKDILLFWRVLKTVSLVPASAGLIVP
jgi:hypothetical protein